MLEIDDELLLTSAALRSDYYYDYESSIGLTLALLISLSRSAQNFLRATYAAKDVTKMKMARMTGPGRTRLTIEPILAPMMAEGSISVMIL